MSYFHQRRLNTVTVPRRREKSLSESPDHRPYRDVHRSSDGRREEDLEDRPTVSRLQSASQQTKSLLRSLFLIVFIFPNELHFRLKVNSIFPIQILLQI